MLELKLLVLLAIANGAPVLAYKYLGNRWDFPLDGSLTLSDGQPLFGESKTLRGILFSILISATFAPFLGIDWKTGALFAFFAMLGDLLSSFTKRRLKLKPSSMALGLDQIPEALLPLFALKEKLALDDTTIFIITVIFFIAELGLSRILYKLHIRKRPY